MTIEPHYRVCQQVRGAVEEDGGVLLNLFSGRLFTLNRIGATVWGEIQKDGFNVPELVVALARRYESVDRDRLQRDVSSFLDRLVSQGFVVRTNGASTVLPESATVISQRSSQSTDDSALLPQREEPSGRPQPSSRVAPFVWRAKACCAMFMVAWTLKCRGFYRLYRGISAQRVRSHQQSSSDAIRMITAALDWAASWHWSNPECLRKSAALVWLLRRGGVMAELVIGCRLRPV